MTNWLNSAPACTVETLSETLSRVGAADEGQKLGYSLKLTGAVRLVDQGTIIPFETTKSFRLNTPPGTTATAQIFSYQCQVFPSDSGWQVGLKIATLIQVSANACLSVPGIVPGHSCLASTNIQVPVVFTGCTLKTGICLQCSPPPLHTEISQYNALARTDARVYTNADEITDFGNQGILDPASVSWVELFINGVLQPPVNYTVQSGVLTLISDDLPLPGSPIILRFISVKDADNTVLTAENSQYCAFGDGSKLIFVDADEIPAYGNVGIQDPAQVSYYNLYVNGVLQPTTNYHVAAGVLTLTTADAPAAGTPITLQAIAIPGSGEPLSAQISIYSARVDGEEYTNQDGIQEYGSSAILDPDSVSFHCLIINGVAQPEVTYSLEPGALTLLGDPPPITGGPITLQFVTIQEYC